MCDNLEIIILVVHNLPVDQWSASDASAWKWTVRTDTASDKNGLVPDRSTVTVRKYRQEFLKNVKKGKRRNSGTPGLRWRRLAPWSPRNVMLAMGSPF